MEKQFLCALIGSCFLGFTVVKVQHIFGGSRWSSAWSKWMMCICMAPLGYWVHTSQLRSYPLVHSSYKANEGSMSARYLRKAMT